MKTLLTHLRHFSVVLLLLAVPAIALALAYGVDLDYGDDMRAWKVGDEGPHVFAAADGWVVNHIRGSRQQGFVLEQQRHPTGQGFETSVHFPLDDSSFSVRVEPGIAAPAAVHEDGQPILAVSDVEGNYRTFRDFLIQQRVMDAALEWTFGRGHLVLVGDFVDRGASTTQLLWLIYKLEQAARAKGGQVHFILGNHEIKNLQGNFRAAHKKYLGVAGILERQHQELTGADSFLGRWLASKNTIEKINGHLFVHGGLHPGLAEAGFDLDQMNRSVREHYRRPYYPRQQRLAEDLLINTQTGLAWYRGYFEDGVSQAQMEATLRHFDAKAVVVGHTPVWRVQTRFDGRLLAIGVKHPLDYRGSLPPRRSEGLLIVGGQYSRALHDGSTVPL
ncbi:metallophosphoesterase [Roseateles microcysteis]|uniref:metallophosphoesterase n=1 Tax=Roseateles microcysteis TaxID=3119057 RepID=UPI002FE6B162